MAPVRPNSCNPRPFLSKFPLKNFRHRAQRHRRKVRRSNGEEESCPRGIHSHLRWEFAQDGRIGRRPLGSFLTPEEAEGVQSWHRPSSPYPDSCMRCAPWNKFCFFTLQISLTSTVEIPLNCTFNYYFPVVEDFILMTDQFSWVVGGFLWMAPRPPFLSSGRLIPICYHYFILTNSVEWFEWRPLFLVFLGSGRFQTFSWVVGVLWIAPSTPFS